MSVVFTDEFTCDSCYGNTWLHFYWWQGRCQLQTQDIMSQQGVVQQYSIHLACERSRVLSQAGLIILSKYLLSTLFSTILPGEGTPIPGLLGIVGGFCGDDTLFFFFCTLIGSLFYASPWSDWPLFQQNKLVYLYNI